MESTATSATLIGIGKGFRDTHDTHTTTSNYAKDQILTDNSSGGKKFAPCRSPDADYIGKGIGMGVAKKLIWSRVGVDWGNWGQLGEALGFKCVCFGALEAVWVQSIPHFFASQATLELFFINTFLINSFSGG